MAIMETMRVALSLQVWYVVTDEVHVSMLLLSSEL